MKLDSRDFFFAGIIFLLFILLFLGLYNSYNRKLKRIEERPSQKVDSLLTNVETPLEYGEVNLEETHIEN